MKIQDRVYGMCEINEPLLVDLINSQALKRIQKISQYGGGSEFYYPYPSKSFSRFEHCVGTALLLRKLDASLGTQVSGLLHDAGHFAFSHVSEWALALRNKDMQAYNNEDLHDKLFLATLKKFEVDKILQKYDIKLEDIEPEKHPLLELPSPKLCADRVDYALREIAVDDEIYAQLLSKNLTTYNNEIVFTSKDTAYLFADRFLNIQTDHWGSPKVTIFFRLLAEAMVNALDEGVLNEEDLYKTDEEVTNLLKTSKHERVQKNLEMLTSGFELKENNENPQYKLRKKFRWVNPKYFENGQVYSLYETDKLFATEVEKHRKINEKGVNVDVFPIDFSIIKKYFKNLKC